MRHKIAIAALALASVVGTFGTVPAHAAVTDPGPGLLCGFSPYTDTATGDGTQTGTVDAGPLAIADDTAPTVVHSGNFVCTIQVGAASTHQTSGQPSVRTNDAARADGPVTPAVIVLPETSISFTANADDAIYLCAEVVVDGQHLYWDDDNTPTGETSGWSSNPVTARCGLAFGAVPEPGPGLLCGFSTITDPTRDDGTQTGTVDAGPLVIAGPTAVPIGHFVCTIQANAATHAGADAARVDGPSTPGVIALPETPVAYTADADDSIYLCTEVVAGGRHFYWDDDNTPTGETSHWSSDAQSARCGLVLSSVVPEEDPLPFDTIYPLLDLVCPVLRVVLPPDGDIAGVWDCPPYEDGPRRSERV